MPDAPSALALSLLYKPSMKALMFTLMVLALVTGCGRENVTASSLVAARSGMCVHDGIQYSVGAIFQDSCNTCACRSSGAVVCTQMACLQ
jgi:hypothetical protein